MRPVLRPVRSVAAAAVAGARRSVVCLVLCLVLTVAAAPALRADTVPTATQTFSLQPGWNAIFLEVAPANPDPVAVFAGLPVDQVWAFFPTRSPVQYLSDPSAGLFNVPGWNGWFPTGSRPDAALLTDLKGIIGHQAYLVKTTGTTAVTLSVTGAAGLQGVKWNPDSFTLTGLPVDATTAGAFFAASPAHAGQSRYRLDPSGTWVPLADTAALVAGQAYWVFTRGGSNFSASLEVGFGGGRVLDFGSDRETARLTVRNLSSSARTFTVTNPGNLPLSYQVVDPTAAVPGNVWRILPASLTVPVGTTLAAGQSFTLTLGVRRAGLQNNVSGFLRVAGDGVALSVPVAAQLPGSTTATAFASNRSALRGGKGTTNDTPTTTNPNAGLWVGTATLNAVTEANATDFTTLTPTPATFGLRLLIHVADDGTTRLLKEVTLMKGRVSPGSTPPLVLVSDPARLTNFDAPTTRDSSPFANRISSIGFDFAGTEVALTGTFGNQLAGSLVIGRTLPTNPFKHKYHPDHDDLDANFAAPAANLPPDQQEVWGITRTLQITFTQPVAGSPDPASGVTERTGTYRETFTGVGTTRLPTAPTVDVANPGLHKNAITVSGPFTLRRLNTIGLLNEAPAEVTY